MEHIKRVGRTLKHKGSILSFYEDDIMTPDGNVAKWDFCRSTVVQLQQLFKLLDDEIEEYFL